MLSTRTVGHAPRTQALAQQTQAMTGPCIGCTGCQGICQALFDAMLLPDLILKERHP